MKVEIDLSDVIDKDGVIVDDVRDEIVAVASQKIIDNANKTLQEAVSKVVIESVEKKMTTFINELLDYEFEKTDSWGGNLEKWTVREKIREEVRGQCVLVDREDSYSRKRNAFTELIDRAISKEVSKSSTVIFKVINETFYNDLMKNAQEQLAKRLGFAKGLV